MDIIRHIKIWLAEWHCIILVLLSLMLQMLLLLLATFRKRTNNAYMRHFTYAVYLLSRWVAAIAFVFLIGRKWLDPKPVKRPHDVWETIMLLHINGHERLTVFTLADNSLSILPWREFVLYFIHFLFIFYRSFTPPTIIMFCLALVRLSAKFWRLKMGTKKRMDHKRFLSIRRDDDQLHMMFEGDVGPNLQAMRNALDRQDEDLQKVRRAHCLLKSSLRLVANITFDNRDGEMEESLVKTYFKGIEPEEALRITEVELNFIYESFHTNGIIRKCQDDCRSTIKYVILRLIELLSFVAVPYLTFFTKSSSYLLQARISSADHVVTHILLWVTVALESISFIMTVLSDWTIVSLSWRGERCGPIASRILFFFNRWWSDYRIYRQGRSKARYLFRRWSETLSNFNFMEYSHQTLYPQDNRFPKCIDYVADLMGFENLGASYCFVTNEWCTDQLAHFIFRELLKERWAGLEKKCNMYNSVLSLYNETNYLYLTNNINDITDPLKRVVEAEHRDYSKILSDYMAYLYFMKPDYITKAFTDPFQSVGADNPYVKNASLLRDGQLNVKNFFREPDNERSWQSVDNERSWQSVSRDWVKLLLHASITCKTSDHVEGLCQGGELISVVWLLAFHLDILSEGQYIDIILA